MVNFEVASTNSFRDIKKNHFVTAEAAAAADIDDSIQRKRFRVSLNNDCFRSSPAELNGAQWGIDPAVR